jgi:NAD(P)-dependent dehydrogenase (short-subunit alcohol dehydrogenase family)
MSESIDPARQLFDPALGRAATTGRLAGRRILIVGAGQQRSDEADPPFGNGRAMSVLFAREGAAVACADRSDTAARATVELIDQDGGTAVALTADVCDPTQIDVLLPAAISALGGLDGLVLNVGIGAGQSLSKITVEGWDRVLETNLRGHMLAARLALGLLEPGGAIVFISSTASRFPASREPAYEASKAALAALCRSVALEGQARGIRANLVLPGLIDTPLGRRATAARPVRTKRPLPFSRQGTAWEVAHTALFLISTESSYVNAHELVADGGLTAGVARRPNAGDHLG